MGFCTCDADTSVSGSASFGKTSLRDGCAGRTCLEKVPTFGARWVRGPAVLSQHPCRNPIEFASFVYNLSVFHLGPGNEKGFLVTRISIQMQEKGQKPFKGFQSSVKAVTLCAWKLVFVPSLPDQVRF